MAVPYSKRYPMQFDELFPDNAYVIGEITAKVRTASPTAMAGPPFRPVVQQAGPDSAARPVCCGVKVGWGLWHSR